MSRKIGLKGSAFILSILIITGIFSGCEIQNGADEEFIISDANEPQNITAADEQIGCGNYPIVLVHGFIGWGRDEMGGHKYWGGYDDLQEILKDEGYECYTGVVGPWSSNWDRACELYAQLMGVRTDYGYAHSLKHGHERYGKDFTGQALLKNTAGIPDWGTEGNHRKIKLIAHSQGGHTVAMLAQLMENGYPDEINAAHPAGEPVSPLFAGRPGTKNMIHSITAMSATLSGTTLANSVDKLIPMVDTLLLNIVGIAGIDQNNTIFNVYDFKLQQFGIKSRQPGESVKDYFARMKTSIRNFMSTNRKDICLWDLSPEGAREENAWVHAQPNIYYFTYATKSTHADLLPDMLDNWERHQVPDINNPLLFIPLAYMMGSYTCNDSRYRGIWRAKNYEFYNMAVKDRPRIDSSWWANDGIVNTKSMNGPWIYPANYTGDKDVIVNWNKSAVPRKGVWNYSGVFTNLDHFDVTGLEILMLDRDNFNSPDFTRHAEDWYVNWAGYLNTLN